MRFFGVLAVYGPGRFPYRRFGMRGPLSGPALSQTRPFRRPGSLSNPALPQARFSLKPGPLSGPALPAHTKVIQTLGRAKFLICFFSRGRDFGLCGGFGARKCAFLAASGREMPFLRKIFRIFAPQGSCTGLRPVGETGIRCESGTVPAAVSSPSLCIARGRRRLPHSLPLASAGKARPSERVRRPALSFFVDLLLRVSGGNHYRAIVVRPSVFRRLSPSGLSPLSSLSGRPAAAIVRWRIVGEDT